MHECGEAFTLLTTAPGPDVAPIHDRQMVIPERSDWSAWLELIGNEADLLRPLHASSLRVALNAPTAQVEIASPDNLMPPRSNIFERGWERAEMKALATAPR